MILADTSVWVEHLRGRASAAAGEFDERLAAEDVLVCGPVATELLTGASAQDRIRLWDTLTTLAWVDLERVDWFVAGETQAELRERGMTIPFGDVVIAAAALTRATLWTHDRHFEQIAEVMDDLELRLFDR